MCFSHGMTHSMPYLVKPNKEYAADALLLFRPLKNEPFEPNLAATVYFIHRISAFLSLSFEWQFLNKTFEQLNT